MTLVKGVLVDDNEQVVIQDNFLEITLSPIKLFNFAPAIGHRGDRGIRDALSTCYI